MPHPATSDEDTAAAAAYTNALMSAAPDVSAAEAEAYRRGKAHGVFLGVCTGNDELFATQGYECTSSTCDHLKDHPKGSIMQVQVEERRGVPTNAAERSTIFSAYSQKGVLEHVYNDDDEYGYYDDEDDPAQRVERAAEEMLCYPVVKRFPFAAAWPSPPAAARLVQPHNQCDVFALKEWDADRLAHVRGTLTRLGEETNDRFIPKYHNIIDPNLFVQKGRWAATEWDVSEGGVPSIVGGALAHAEASVVDSVFTPILRLALPVLCQQLQRPALYFKGRRLQAVVKAQRIVVPPAGVKLEGEDVDGEGGSYTGLWHVDGDVEDIVAVVLYYYNVDEGLEGGSMEFASKGRVEVVGYGDCAAQTYFSLTPRQLKESMGNGVFRRCKVPVETGTVLVFSNHQMVHRVLKMVNRRGDGREASRDFAAMFIVNPRTKLPSASAYLASPERQLQTQEDRLATRLTKLRAQLSPSGSFGENSNVYATGNGCFRMLSWLNERLEQSALADSDPGWQPVFASLSLSPAGLNRGMSELVSSEGGAVAWSSGSYLGGIQERRRKSNDDAARLRELLGVAGDTE
eukprot:Rhum_TRINITY_DN16683_c0_g1::Rhum_TRINITY_DN16683_c0_g1_i1::g.164023::m.164023